MLECAFIAVKITECIGIRPERNAATTQCRRLEYSLESLNAALNQPKRSGLFRHDVIQKKHSIIQQGIKSPPEYCIPTVGAVTLSFIHHELQRVGPEAASPASRRHGGITAACSMLLRNSLFQAERSLRTHRAGSSAGLHSRL